MNYRVYQQKLHTFWKERNGYLICALGALGICLLLATLVGIAFNRERIILVPPLLTEKASISQQSVSRSYLRQVSLYLVNLRLNVTADIVEGQYQLLLEQVVPIARAKLNHDWHGEIEQIKAEQLTQVFYPSEIKVEPDELKVRIHGELQRSISNTQVLKKKVGYQLRYQLYQGRLWLYEFKEDTQDE